MNIYESNNAHDYKKVITGDINCKKFFIYEQLDLSNVSPELKVAKTRHEFERIWAFREREYRRILPDIRGFENDRYDRSAVVLYTENSAGEITSTGRIAFDGPHGLPEESLVHFLIKHHRQRNLRLAEYGRVIIRDNARTGLIKHYFRSVYSIAADNGIEQIIVVSKRKDIGFYLRMVGASLLSDDLNETFGGKEPYACVEWKISETNTRFLQWCGLR